MERKVEDKLAGILHSSWKEGHKPNVISGIWAEDGSEYQIIIPPQLRNQLLIMQNSLHKRYIRCKSYEMKLINLRHEIESLLEELI